MKKFISAVTAALIIFIACRKSDNNPGGGGNGGGGGNSAVEITATPDGYPFWGDTLTITGKGFGTVAADVAVKYLGGITEYSTAAGNVKVVSVTNTQLKVTAPITISASSGTKSGPDASRIIVTVNGKSDTSNSLINFVGWPTLSGMCYHYGGVAHTLTTRPGDSVILSGGVRGFNAKASGYADKLKLYIGNTLIPTVNRSIGLCSGMAFMLDAATYADVNNCTATAGTIGPARKFTFRLVIDGTNKFDTVSYFVLNQPNMTITQILGTTSASKTAGGNPTFEILGRNIYISRLKWSTSGDSFYTSTSNGGAITDRIPVTIPLSLMQANKLYTVTGETSCGTGISVTTVQITP